MEKSLRGINLVFGLLLVTVLTFTITNKKFISLKNTEATYHPPIAVVEKRLECLAINIYKEAANEPFEGKVAVAQVTMNRVESGKFAKDVCAVVYQKNVIMEKVVCQFSWYCDHAYRSKPVNQKLYDESYEVAKKVMLEGFRLSSMEDALYYHADYVNPNWKYKRIGKIGSHIFYKG